MRKKVFLLCFILAGTLFSGCAVPERAIQLLEEAGLVEEVEEPDYSMVSGELESVSVEFPTGTGYYVWHDGLYYPCMLKDWTDDEGFAKDYYMSTDYDDLRVKKHRFALNATYDVKVPTLYLENGDMLIYYSPRSILNYYVFAKYWDLGYSIPIVNYYTTVAGYPYISISVKAEAGSYSCSLLPSKLKDSILEMERFSDDDDYASMRFLALNGTPVDESYIENGIIYGLNKNESYLVNATIGSDNYDFTAAAEYHFFMEGEIYTEATYETLYDDTYRIDIPDYLTSGYYMMGNGQVFRLVTEGDTYDLYNTDEEQFNTKTLYLDGEYALAHGGSIGEDGYVHDSEGNTVYTNYGVYSSDPRLNCYSTLAVGALGYEEPETAAKEEDEQQEISSMQTGYYKLVPVGEVTLEEGTALYEVLSSASGSTPPCIITQYIGGSTQVLDAIKEGDNYHYRYAAEEGRIMDVPVYLVCECPNGIIPVINILADGFTLEEVTDREEMERIGTEDETQRRQ